MKSFDVFLRNQIHTMDVYLRELALHTDLTAYDQLIIRTQMAAVLLYKYTSGSSEWLLSTDVAQACLTLFESMKSDMSLNSKIDPLMVLFAKAEETPVLLQTQGASATTKLNADITTFLEMSSQLTSAAVLKLSAKASKNFTITGECTAGLTVNSTFADVMQFVNETSTAILLFVHATNDLELSTQAAVTYITRYRRFSDMENLTFADIMNMTLEELVFITT